MKKLNVKVETVYTIEVEFKDFAEAKEKWTKEESTERIMFPKAFDNNDMTLGTLHKEFKEFRPHGDRSGLMADFLGFDGWKSCLFYHGDKLTMVVYKNGDSLN